MLRVKDRLSLNVLRIRWAVAAPHQGVPGQMPWQKCLRPGCCPGCRHGS